VTSLPPPELVGCYSDLGFTPPLAAMQLHWPAACAEAMQNWLLPRGEALSGPPQRRFGLLVRRQSEDAYAISLVWDSACRQWFSLRRHEVLGTALEPVLAALGTQLVYLLDQPVLAAHSLPTAA
jgi:hypothetical protein